MTRGLVAIALLVAVTGCARPVSGLRPGAVAWPASAPLAPTLRWEPFPGATRWELDGVVGRVTYDVRIWRAAPGATLPWTLVYARDGLPAPEHTVETGLEPEQDYCWTVRARLAIDGATRVTSWSRYANDPGARDDVPDRRLFVFRAPRR